MKATLYCQNETSDKVYQVEVTTKGGLYQVAFAYGRRGGTMNIGTKTGWVSKVAAEDMFKSLIREKLAKGYNFGLPGASCAPPETGFEAHARSLTETLGYTTPEPKPLLPQLLNPITAAEADDYLHHPEYCAQEKFDGKRILIRKFAEALDAINRKGIVCGMSAAIVRAMSVLPDCILDGEAIGDKFNAFDILSLKGKDLRGDKYKVRLVHLMNLFPGTSPVRCLGGVITMADTAYTESAKKDMMAKLLKENREGIVFKRVNAVYTAGRPNSGGDQFKYKFYETLSAVVSKLNFKRSVAVKLLGADDEWHESGNVTIPPNHRIPCEGAVVEVRYLYAFPESGILYQPVYLGERDDISLSACLTSQLKFKPKEPEPGISEADVAGFLGE